MRSLLCLTILIGAAACQREAEKPAEPVITAEQVAAELAKVEVDPGQWESTTEILSAEGPLPQAARAKMVGKRTRVSNCITPEQAKRPSANFLAAQQNSDCTYHQFSMQGGRLTGRMACTSQQMAGEMVTEMQGQYGPKSYDMTMKMSPALPGGGAMTITARTQGKRVGECA